MQITRRVACIWTLLAVGSFAAPQFGAGLSAVAAATAATIVAWAPHRCRVTTALLVAGWTAGYAALPAWLALIAVVGDVLGLAPAEPAGAPGPALAFTALVLAPLWEEHLYRGHVLDAVRAHLGAVPAVLASSALFAAPHAEAWAVLGTSLVGLGLGALRCAGAPLGVCVALHAGLNARALLDLAAIPDV